MMSKPGPRVWKIAIAVLASSALGACSGSSTPKVTVGATVPGGGPTLPVATNPPTTVQASNAAAAATGGVSGTWSGQYSGGFTGTFNLTWQQSGSDLSGSINLSSPAVTLPITGTVSGSAINFGTVGSSGVTYTGTLSGGTMSGTWKAGNTTSGSWSASKA